MGKAKGTSEVETRDANKHLSAQKSPSPGEKKKKKFKLKTSIMPNKIVAKAKDFGIRISKYPLHQFSSVAQSFLTLCNPMDCNMPGLPVHHQLLESTQTHVH